MNEQSKAVVASSTAVALQDQMTMAEAFFKSGLFKDMNDSAQALVKIVKGQELGLAPMAAMEAFDVVQGRLRMTARCCAALVNACHYASFLPISSDAEQCTIRFSKKTREGWVDLPDVQYTIEIAKARGMLDIKTNRDGKEYDKSPEWKSDPKNMLYWRAIQRGTTYYFPELMAGMEADLDLEPVTTKQKDKAVSDLFGDTVDTLTGEVVAEAEKFDNQHGSTSVKYPPGFEPRAHLMAKIIDWANDNGKVLNVVQDWCLSAHGAGLKEMSDDMLRRVYNDITLPDPDFVKYHLKPTEATTSDEGSDAGDSTGEHEKVVLSIKDACETHEIDAWALGVWVQRKYNTRFSELDTEALQDVLDAVKNPTQAMKNALLDIEAEKTSAK